MAPAAVETITTTTAPAVLKLHSTQGGTGDYKQLQPHGFDREAEEGKKEGFEAATVSLVYFCLPGYHFLASLPDIPLFAPPPPANTKNEKI